MICCCYYKSPRIEPQEVLNGREAAVPEKETELVKKGAHGKMGSLIKKQS